VPLHALERIGFNEGDLSFMLSDNNSCKQRFSKHNYTVMFGNEKIWDDVRLWSQSVTLYSTWQEIGQMKDEILLCIRFKDEWEPVWKGKFSLKGTWDLYIAHRSFFCNKNDLLSKWECNSYEPYIGNDKKEEIYKLLTKYDEKSSPSKLLKSQ
jgi:hypothetical protein